MTQHIEISISSGDGRVEESTSFLDSRPDVEDRVFLGVRDALVKLGRFEDSGIPVAITIQKVAALTQCQHPANRIRRDPTTPQRTCKDCGKELDYA